jgi:hypothetical protein
MADNHKAHGQQDPTKTGPRPKQMVEGTFMGLPVGRDKTVVDPSEVEKLAALGCKDREIANWFGIKEDTLRYNFAEELIKGREGMKISLRRAMLTNAIQNNNAVLQIFLSKNFLGMMDQPTNTEDSKVLPWSDDDLDTEVDADAFEQTTADHSTEQE